MAIKRQHRLNMFLRLAQREGRHLIKGSTFLSPNPSVLFLHGSRRIQLEIEDISGDAAVRCAISMADLLPKDIRLYIHTRHWSFAVDKDVPLADRDELPRDILSDLTLRTTDDDVLQGLMTARSCMHVLQLLQLFNEKNLFVEYSGTHLIVRKYCNLKEERKLRLFYETFVAFVNGYIDALGRPGLPMEKRETLGIEGDPDGRLLEDNSLQPATADEFQVIDQDEEIEQHCQICGETIVEDHVRCCQCATPHHEDCWQYYGECATFGCQSTKCQKVSISPQSQSSA